MRCCPKCFDDRGLRENIIPTLNPTHGTCDFCGSEDVDLVEPHQLIDAFELLVNVYERNSNGKTLIEWMKEDWLLFSHPMMDHVRAGNLLAKILDDSGIVGERFVPSPAYRSEGLARWDTLRDELLYKNRYFLDEALDIDRLKELIDHLPADDLPSIWYRARTLLRDEPYSIEEMGAPPKRSATHGRANPPGIPYLYVSTLPETAVAELRPHTGEIACVAAFAVPTPLNAVNLCNPRKLVSPFVLADATAIGQLRADIPFLERLGEELTRPILPSGAAIDYVPSQYLCEFIKKSGKDGVVYKSSVSSGINLAFFDPAKAVGGSVSLYKIENVAVTIAPVALPGASESANA